MTLSSIVTDRYARWVHALDRYGYEVESHPRLPTSAKGGTVGLRGRRRADLGGPQVVIDVTEVWEQGADPNGLGLEQHGCHLVGSGWHAQLKSGEEGAERLDVDRFKPGHLMIHRHPLGSPNDEREPVGDLPVPEVWVRHVETIAAERYLLDQAD